MDTPLFHYFSLLCHTHKYALFQKIHEFLVGILTIILLFIGVWQKDIPHFNSEAAKFLKDWTKLNIGKTLLFALDISPVSMALVFRQKN